MVKAAPFPLFPTARNGGSSIFRKAHPRCIVLIPYTYWAQTQLPHQIPSNDQLQKTYNFQAHLSFQDQTIFLVRRSLAPPP